MTVFEDCNQCNHQNRIEHKHRDFTSHMMLSHFFILLPSLWWLFGYNKGNYVSHCVDKIMAIVLASSIIISSIYHYYYECVLCNFEYRTMLFNTLLLNIYMVYRGVKYFYIFLGFFILLFLKLMVDVIYYNNETDFYESYHPYCHYVAGIYVAYCVYFIEKTFK
tara:strand:+ start:10725 stop:11216 length:492 start_codon:yes stop_codon:yes gene_type:complete